MIKGEDDDYEELRRRLARVELLASLALVGSNADWDDETGYFLRRYLRDFPRGRGPRQEKDLFRDSREFEFLLDRLSSSGSSRSSRIENDLSTFKEQHANSTSQNERRIEAVSERLAEISHSVESLSERNTTLSASTNE